MLLYKNPLNKYLAIAEELGISKFHGFHPCFGGKHVPEIICRAYIRDYGGVFIRELDDECAVYDFPLSRNRAA